MKGFDTKALILFPKIENYQNKNSLYKYQFKQAVDKLVTYLKTQNIEPQAFYTDDVAREIAHPDFKWVMPLTIADRFFINKHCVNTDLAMSDDMVTFDEIADAVLAKDPGSLDMSESERFEMVLRHISKTTAKIIPQYKIVVHFVIPNKAQYKVSSKPGDGKIRIIVSANTLSPKVYVSGSEEDACDLLGVPYGNRCLNVWEV